MIFSLDTGDDLANYSICEKQLWAPFLELQGICLNGDDQLLVLKSHWGVKLLVTFDIGQP